MAIWRYKGPGNCNSVYSLDLPNPLGYTWTTRVALIRGIYVGCLVYTGCIRGTLTAAVSNWLAGVHISFDVKKVRSSLSFMCRFVAEVVSARAEP